MQSLKCGACNWSSCSSNGSLGPKAIYEAQSVVHEAQTVEVSTSWPIIALAAHIRLYLCARDVLEVEVDEVDGDVRLQEVDDLPWRCSRGRLLCLRTHVMHL